MTETRGTRKMEEEIATLTESLKIKLGDPAFAMTTRYSELGIVDGQIFDYMLLEITAPGRLGVNRLDGMMLRDTTRPLQVHMLVNMVGRTSWKTSGTVLGESTTSVERLEGTFTTWYSYGDRPEHMSNIGNSGSWRRTDKEAVAYVYGGGRTHDVFLDATWIIRIQDVLARIKERWGLSLEVFNIAKGDE